jgi:two-component system, sensor histidine kinase and response regulator
MLPAPVKIGFCILAAGLLILPLRLSGQTPEEIEEQLSTASHQDSISLLMELADYHFKGEAYEQSLELYFQLLEMGEKTRDLFTVARAANNLGRIHYQLRNDAASLKYYRRALDIYQQNGDSTNIAGVLNNLGLLYFDMDSLPQALDQFNKALSIKLKTGKQEDVAAIYHNLALIYNEEQKFDDAIRNLRKAFEIFTLAGNTRHQANILNNIGRTYYRKGQYARALTVFDSAYQLARTGKQDLIRMDNYLYRSQLYAQTGDYESAFFLRNNYHMLKDSILSNENKRHLAEIQERYETQIKDRENSILRKENEARKAIIRTQSIGGLAALAILVLLSALLVLAYRSNVEKRRSNLLLEAQKTEIERKNQDLSELNRAIGEQKARLEELNNIKDKLFSVISHEFRSPLNSLKGTLTLMAAGALSEKELTQLSRDLQEKIDITGIFLDNLLNWAKSQMKGIEVHPVEIRLHDLTDECILLLRTPAERKGIQISNKVTPDIIAYADQDMVNLIIKNLVSNAIKFCLKSGLVEIDAGISGKRVDITVQDNGVGIGKENLEKLMGQVSFTTRGTANERGTGLGLYITKSFVEYHGGQFIVESVEGKGSTFRFDLPASVVA